MKTAPQNKLPGYDPLVMSKLLLLRDAAQTNHFRTKYHLVRRFMCILSRGFAVADELGHGSLRALLQWLDAGHLCAFNLNPIRMKTFLTRMDKLLVTYWPYG